jgi:hypothetical protein
MKLPKPLQYLEAPARRYATNDVLWVPNSYRYIKRLKLDDIDTLAKVYQTIQKRKHARRIGNWLKQADPETRKPEGAVWRLGLLFEHLAELDIEPFRQRSVDIFEADDELVDFSKLPPGFEFLIPAAVEFGHVFGEDAVSNALQEIERESEKKKLIRQVANTLRVEKKDRKLQKWLDDCESAENPAADRIRCVVQLLDWAGLKWQNEYPEDRDPKVLKKQWATLHWSKLSNMIDQTLAVFTPDECFDFVVDSLKRTAPSDIGIAMYMLHDFRSPRTLDWIEANVAAARSAMNIDSMGIMAATAPLTWERAKSWLQASARLRRVAVCALTQFYDPETEALQEMRPKLIDAPSAAAMSRVLNAVRKRECNGKVQKRIRVLTEHLSEIA